MNELLAHAEVVPFYAQAMFGVPGSTNLPDWQTGQEGAVATSAVIYVSTRSDFVDSNIIELPIEVWQGNDSAAMGELIADVVLSAPDGLFEFGMLMDDDAPQVQVGSPGDYRVRAYSDSASLRQQIRFLVSDTAE